MPNKDNFYKGYSPPKCTCNDHSTFLIHIPTRTFQFYMESYMPCHEMRCDSSCTMCPSPHRLPHITPKPMCEKQSFWMTFNDHFSKQFSFVYKPKAFWMIHHNDHLYSTSCVFLWVANFRGLIAIFASLPTLSWAFSVGHICITKTNGVFT